jgi:hypothetical protein
MPGVQNPHCSPCFSVNPSVRLNGKKRARLNRLTVEVDGTGTAMTGLAADVAARESEFLAECVNEQLTRLHGDLMRLAVDGHGN